MVHSKINPEINYTENKILHPEDIGHQTSMYMMDIHDISTTIVLGKPKYTYSAKGVIYFPVYVVANDKIKSQIGVFETKLTETLNIYDEEGDIDIDKFDDILLYPFVTKKYIEKSNTNPKEYLEKSDEAFEKERKEKEKEMEIEEKEMEKKKEEDSDELDVLQLKVSKMKISSEKEKIDTMLEDGVFTIDQQFKQPSLLDEETEEDADKIKKEYKESARNEWIEKFMKNNHYGIIDNEGSGDCLFAVIRDAYEHIGYKTTVAKLRAIVASHLTESVFDENRKLYLDFENNLLSIQKEIKEIKNTNTLYSQRMKKTTTTKEERDKIIEEAKQLEELYKKKNKDLKEMKALQENYVGFMKDIDTIDKYREYILTSRYWADAWAISTLEYVLEMKMCILSEEAYKNKAYDNVLNCGEINRDIQQKKNFEPKFYIMTSYDGSHYKLITYKRKHIFTFREIPYDIKILVINKCLEKNSGVYYMIPDFRNFKTRIGIDADEGNPEMEEEDDLDSDLYNKSVVFVFHSKSLNTAKPGKGSNEKIEDTRRNEFAVLTKIKDWRRKLDDSWTEAPFLIERHRWASVEHYLQASKFKKGFPDFYAQFSLDHPSDLSKDVELAKGVASLANKKYNNMRPENVKIDVDYNLGRDLEERETAVYAKFSQNQDLKEMLLATRDALLKQYLRRKPASADTILMKVRNKIRIESNR
jgi:predicted NAD-dependent protein-ADP-ribosyltransferase YbiA (DUF1768 family)